MRHALEQSRNVPAVKTLSKVGVARASLFARKMGVNVPSDSGLSVAIGANASSLQMAGAFAAFANNGIYHKPQFVSKIETPDGLTRNYDSNGTKVMKESTAYIMTDMLKGVLTKGSGTQARIKNLYEAGKTGTVKYSDEELVRYPQYKNSPKDSWFVGYTKLYSIGIWTGYDNLKDGTPSGVGASSAQLLYKQMMSYLMKDKANKDWNKPSTVVRRRIANGTQDKVVSPNASNSSWQLFVKGHAPSNPYSEVTVDKRKDEEDDDIDTRIDTEDDTSSKGQSHSQSSSSSSSRSQQSSSQKQLSTSENRTSNNQNNNQQNENRSDNQQNNNNSQQQNQNNQNNNQNQQQNQKNNSNNH